MLKLIPDALTSLLYPQSCSVCKQSVEASADGVACRDCWNKTRIFSLADVLCSKCGAFLKESGQPAETRCRHCDEHYYDSARAAGVYDNALAASVINLKHFPRVAKTARDCLIDAFENHSLDRADLIVPVPLSSKRLIERGFNQAAVLARIVADTSGIPLDEHSLVRTIHTPMHRTAMDKKARETTVKNAFAVIRTNLIAGKSVLLIDDVFTSGSTASHCSKVLKKSGAVRVDILTLARAV